MSDLIRREDAIKAYNEAMEELVKWQMEEWGPMDFSECEFNTTDCKHIARKLEAIPSADRPHSDDWEKYSDKLWRTAYERGKADRPQGEWVLFEYGDEKWHKCTACGVADRYIEYVERPKRILRS